MNRGDFGFSQQSSAADYGAVSYHRSTAAREKGINNFGSIGLIQYTLEK